MKCFFKVLYLFLILTPLPTHTNYWSRGHQKKQTFVAINPQKKVEYLELYAEQNDTKAKQGLTACVLGALATAGRLYQRNGHVEPVSLGALVFCLVSGGYAGWCTWSAQSARAQVSELQQEHNIIVVHYQGDEEYLENTTSERRHSI